MRAARVIAVLAGLLWAGPSNAQQEPPEVPDTPDPRPVQVDGEAWVALHPDLYRWRLARSAYATQLEVDRDRLAGLVEAGTLDLDACRIRLDVEQDVSEAWARRVEEWEVYASRIEKRERRQGLRDAALVLGGAAVVVGGAWVASLAP